MTPKEKAIKLVNYFTTIFQTSNIDSYFEVSKQYAKVCSIKVVDEIIKSNPCIYRKLSGIRYNKKYWEEVKQEIKKL
jgi:hypothetical protein